ncbi:unnamed protein product, partial [Sphagnum jensenii]
MDQASNGSLMQSCNEDEVEDDEEIERSRHFAQALKELKSLRPQLYSAAEYCESSYLYSDQKQVVLDNLKEYSVKALVNAVDHLGTVAYKFNDLLSHETSEISTTELRAASLAQRMRSCQEHSDREGLKQQSLAKPMQVNHKHYVLPEPYPLVEENTTTILRERFDSSQVRSKSRSSRQTKESNTTAEPQLVAPPPPPLSKDPSPSSDIAGSSESNPSAWHFASDGPTVANTTASNGQQPAIGVVAAGQRTPPPASGAKVLETSLPKGSFLTSSLYNAKSMPKTMEAGSGGLSSSKYPDSAKVSATRSGSFTPLKTAPTAQSKASPPSPRSASLFAAVLSWCHDTSTVMSVYSPMK